MRNILIIDSDIQTAENFKILLENNGGFKVFLAMNEKETMSIMEKENIDWIIFEPILPHEVLLNPKEINKEVQYIGAGLILFNKIIAKKENQNFVICSVEPTWEFLVSNGLPFPDEKCLYLNKPIRVETIINFIHT